jgi:hypothetical protein
VVGVHGVGVIESGIRSARKQEERGDGEKKERGANDAAAILRA